MSAFKPAYLLLGNFELIECFNQVLHAFIPIGRADSVGERIVMALLERATSGVVAS